MDEENNSKYTNMDVEEIHEMLEHNTKLLEQNNRIMRKIQRGMRASMFFRMFYWTLIIGSMFGAYYYFQPLIQNITDAYGNLIAIPDKLKVW